MNLIAFLALLSLARAGVADIKSLNAIDGSPGTFSVVCQDGSNGKVTTKAVLNNDVCTTHYRLEDGCYAQVRSGSDQRAPMFIKNLDADVLQSTYPESSPDSTTPFKWNSSAYVCYGGIYCIGDDADTSLTPIAGSTTSFYQLEPNFDGASVLFEKQSSNEQCNPQK